MVELNWGIIMLLGFLALMILRFPLYLSLLVPPMVYVLVEGIPITLVSQRMIRTMDSFTLLAIPMFIYVGSYMNESGLTDTIFDFVNNVVGDISGGLAQVNIGASLIFSGMSGSAIADVGGIGKILIQTMKENGYSDSYSAAITSASATIGPIFPPSIPLILYAVLADVSAIGLLIAGIGPALITVLLLSIVTFYLSRKHDHPKGSGVSRREILSSFATAIPALLAPAVLVGGMLSGFFGPTEASAVTIGYAIIVSIFIYRDGRRVPNYMWRAGMDTVRTTAVILVIVAGAALFGWVLSVERTPQLVSEMLFRISENPVIVILMVNVFLLLVGMFLEPISALVMTIPIVVPTLAAIGVDPIHIGIIMVFNLMVGLLTPPMGLLVFLSSDISGAKPEDIIGSLKPYYVVLGVALLLISFYPPLSLFLV